MSDQTLLLKKIDYTLDSMKFWIPRISNLENTKTWVEIYNHFLFFRDVLDGKIDNWELTPKRFEDIKNYLESVNKDLPPIRVGHPDDVAKGETFHHGSSCPCDWCEERNANERNFHSSAS